MKVRELAAYLQSLPPEVQDLEVVYCCYSEQQLLDIDELKVQQLCLPRPDGWVQNKRPDMPSVGYLVFPGN